MECSLALVPGLQTRNEGRVFLAVQWPGIEAKWSLVVIVSLCVFLQDLKVFSEEHGITLTTHSDERDILPDPQLQAMMGGVCGSHDYQWRYNWAAKYSSVIRMRGIIAHKG